METEAIRKLFSRSWSSVGGETPCGNGSTLASTEALRIALPDIIRKNGVKVINDAGCGDFHWIKSLKWFFRKNGIDYLGYDIVDRKVRGVFPFQILDIRNEEMRLCDLIICHDVLGHYSNDHVAAILARFKQKGKYLLATSAVCDNSKRKGIKGENSWIGGFRPVFLGDPAFGLGTPIFTIDEPTLRRYQGLWKL